MVIFDHLEHKPVSPTPTVWKTEMWSLVACKDQQVIEKFVAGYIDLEH